MLRGNLCVKYRIRIFFLWTVVDSIYFILIFLIVLFLHLWHAYFNQWLKLVILICLFLFFVLTPEFLELFLERFLLFFVQVCCLNICINIVFTRRRHYRDVCIYIYIILYIALYFYIPMAVLSYSLSPILF